MAQQKRRTTTSNNNTRKRSSGNRRPSNGRSPAKKQSVQTNDVGFADYIYVFFKSKAFFPVVTILVITFIILIDLLVSWNSFDRFFLILAVELILAAIISIIRLVLELGKDNLTEEGGAE